MKNYLPLFVIVSLIGLASLLKSDLVIATFVLNFMTGFFIVFGSVKLLDIKQFAQGFSKYDLIANKIPGYAYTYPFIELSFGFLMLAGFHPDWLIYLEIFIMIIGGLGVAQKIYSGEKFNCACLGSILNVPLTYVTLIENFGMAILGLILIALS